MQAVIINAVWAADIELQFNSSPANIVLEGNKLDKGIARFCEQAALLWTASLFDGDARATSLKYFLDLADDNSALFVEITEEQVKASVEAHRKWIDDNKDTITELKEFRNTQIAHLDKSSVKDYFDGKIAGVSNILGPTVVEKSAKLLEEVIRIVDFYTRSYNGETFNLEFMRGQIKADCTAYVLYRSKQNTAN